MTDTTEQTNEQPTALNIQDLIAFREIIDIASSRGAFKPNEMLFVGHAYQKLTSFIDTVQAHIKENQPGEKE